MIINTTLRVLQSDINKAIKIRKEHYYDIGYSICNECILSQAVRRIMPEITSCSTGRGTTYLFKDDKQIGEIKYLSDKLIDISGSVSSTWDNIKPTMGKVRIELK